MPAEVKLHGLTAIQLDLHLIYSILGCAENGIKRTYMRGGYN